MFAKGDGGENVREDMFAKGDGRENVREGMFAKDDLQGHGENPPFDSLVWSSLRHAPIKRRTTFLRTK